jgi:hypothetical protein
MIAAILVATARDDAVVNGGANNRFCRRSIHMSSNLKARNAGPASSRPGDPATSPASALAGAPPAVAEHVEATPPAKVAPAAAIDRWQMISQVAYFKAAQRGFAPGYEWEDWFAAEREIDAQS